MNVFLPERLSVRQTLRRVGPKRVRITLTFPVLHAGVEGRGTSRAAYIVDLDWRDLPERELVANPFLVPSDVAQPWWFRAELRSETVKETYVPPSLRHGPRRRDRDAASTHASHRLEATLVVLRGVKVTTSIPGTEAGEGLEGLKALFERFLRFTLLRVQDVKLLPLPGEAIDREMLLPTYNAADLVEVDPTLPDSVQEQRRRTSLANVIVHYIDNGVRIQWLWTKQVLQIRLKDPLSHESGFSVHVREDAPRSTQVNFDRPLRYEDLVHVKVCGSIDVKATSLPGNPMDAVHLSRTRLPVEARTDPENLRFYRIERVRGVAELPGPEEPFACETHDSTIPIGELDEDFISKLAIDLVIGAIPVVGDLIEIGEFFYALVEGKDKYGDEVDNAELVLMGIGAFVPVLSSRALREGYRAAARAVSIE